MKHISRFAVYFLLAAFIVAPLFVVAATLPAPASAGRLVTWLQQAPAGISPDVLNGLTMALLSLFLTYVPGLNEKYAALAPTQKRLVWLALLAVGTIGWLTYTCSAEAGCLALNSKAYFEALVKTMIGGVTGSVGTYMLTTPPMEVRRKAAEAKAKATARTPKAPFVGPGPV